MLYKEIFVLFLGFYSGSLAQEGYSLTCSGLRDGQTFPHMTECNLFYKCVSEKLTLAQCHSSFWWDSTRKMCLPKMIANCAVKPEIEVTSEINVSNSSENIESNELSSSESVSTGGSSESHSQSQQSSESLPSSFENSNSESRESSSHESSSHESVSHESLSHESLSHESSSHESSSHESSSHESLSHESSESKGSNSNSNEGDGLGSHEDSGSNDHSKSENNESKSGSQEMSNSESHEDSQSTEDKILPHIPTAPTPSTAKPTTTLPILNIQCPELGVSTLPHKSSCSKYVICFDGTPVVQDCAPGLHFDAIRSQCTFPEHTQCHLFDQICPENDSAQNIFYIADKFDCAKYYYCYNGKPFAQTCADGLHWDAKNKWCTKTEEAYCNIFQPFEIAEGSTRMYSKVCSNKMTTYWQAHPIDEQKYFLCHLGEPWGKKCDEGLLWDSKNESCNFKDKYM